MNLFELSATLSLNKDMYVRGLKEAKGETESFGGKMVKSLGNTAKLAAAKAADAAVSAVKNFTSESLSLSMGFSKSVSQVAATMGLNMDEFSKMTAKTSNQYGEFEGNLKEFARWMGSNSAFTASQAAEALNYMALAGYDVQQSMDMLPNVFNLAAAGGMELASASDMITDAQTALGLSFEETNRMVDQMAVTSSKANTSVAQLGEAILTVGAYGKQLAGGTTELNMLLGVLADNSIKGAEGGIKLRNIIRALATPMDQGAKQLKKLGVSAYDGNGNLRSMIDIFNDLNVAMIGKTGEERNQILSEIFNAADLAAINALLDTARERWDSLEESIENAEGAAQEMGEVQLDNLAGDIVKLGSAWDDVKLTIGDTLEQYARPFVQTMTDGVGNIGRALKEEGFMGALREAKNLVSALYDQVVSGLKNSDSTGLQQIGKWLEDIKSIGGTVAGAVSDGVKAIGDVASAFKEGGFTAAFETAKTKVEEFWSSVKKEFSESDSVGLQQVASLMGTVEDALKWIQNNQSTVSTAIQTIVAAFAVDKVFEFAAHIKTISDTIGAISLNPLILGALVLGAAIIDIKNNWEGIKEAATGAWESVKNSWGSAKQWFETNISNPIKEFTDAPAEKKIKIMQDAAENLGKIMGEIAEFLAQPITKTIQLFASWGDPHNKMESVMNMGVPPTIWNSGTTTTTKTGAGGRTRTPGQSGSAGTAVPAGTRTQVIDLPTSTNANGLSFVPWDGWVSSLHRGEMVLNRNQAELYRNGMGGGSVDTSAIAAAVSQAIRESMANMGVMIDGQTAGAMVAGSVSRSIAGQVRRGRFN